VAEDIDNVETDDPISDKEPKSSRSWLAMVSEAEKAFGPYHDKADNIDKLYASLDRLASMTRDRQFQLFWANIQVLGPSIYSRPPVPVVVPRFRDRRQINQTASELLERSTSVAFEMEDIDGLMRLVRDDLVVTARGCIWVRFEKRSKDDPERVCLEHIQRRDFLHAPARSWREVDWVGKRSWMTRREMRKRFHPNSRDAYQNASFEVRKDANDTDDGRQKAAVWEIWHKGVNKVVWISEGVDVLLDEGEPHLSLEGFFPCPRPAYATVQRGSLVPVPDMVFYKDQLEEINELTGRISALSEAVKLRGFYPAGMGEISDAVEAAVKTQSDSVVLVPVSNWAAIGEGSVKDMIVWLPLDMVVGAIQQLVTMRRQLIDDVYQVTGLSDIMRGSTAASETLGAQQLKSQYGSIRIRDRQDELVRIARDVVRIAAEIMAENFQAKTLIAMSQLDVETDADLAKRTKPLQDKRSDLKQQIKDGEAERAKTIKDIEGAQKDLETMRFARANPERAQQILQEAQGQVQAITDGLAKAQARIAALDAEIEKHAELPTVERITKLLKDERLRPFVLDIETDSTIAPDENAQKQRATEYLTAMGSLIAQAMPVLTAFPEAAPLVGDTIRFAQAQFRAGRQMNQTVEDFVDRMKALAEQPAPKPDDGAAQAAEADQARMQAEMQVKQAELALRGQEISAKVAAIGAESQAKQAEVGARVQTIQIENAGKQAEFERMAMSLDAKRAMDAERHGQDMQLGALKVQLIQAQIQRLGAQAAGDAQAAAIDAEQHDADMAIAAASAQPDVMVAVPE
jgi:hypothetical protein